LESHSLRKKTEGWNILWREWLFYAIFAREIKCGRPLILARLTLFRRSDIIRPTVMIAVFLDRRQTDLPLVFSGNEKGFRPHDRA
jgi:hypothetical protein